MHFVTAMNHKKYKTRVLSNSKRDTWFAFGILLYLTATFIALIIVY